MILNTFKHSGNKIRCRITLKSVGVTKQRLEGRGLMVATLMSTEPLSLAFFWDGGTSSTLSMTNEKHFTLKKQKKDIHNF